MYLFTLKRTTYVYGIRAVFGPHWNFNHVTFFVIGTSQNVAYVYVRTCGFENINKFILTHICPCFVLSKGVGLVIFCSFFFSFSKY